MHETKLEILPVIAAATSVRIASHHCHVIFCSLEKYLLFPKFLFQLHVHLGTYCTEYKYVSKCLLRLGLALTPQIMLHLKVCIFIQLKSELVSHIY